MLKEFDTGYDFSNFSAEVSKPYKPSKVDAQVGLLQDTLDTLDTLDSTGTKKTAFENSVTSLPVKRDRDEIAERAAMVEIGAKVPQEWAEGYARLCVMPRPQSIQAGRWQQIVDDAGHFLDQWAVCADQLGWSTTDLFGVHPTKPVDRLDTMGLVIIIQGRAVAAITSASISIKTASGGLSQYRRTKGAQGAVPVWELLDRHNVPDGHN